MKGTSKMSKDFSENATDEETKGPSQQYDISKEVIIRAGSIKLEKANRRSSKKLYQSKMKKSFSISLRLDHINRRDHLKSQGVPFTPNSIAKKFSGNLLDTPEKPESVVSYSSHSVKSSRSFSGKDKPLESSNRRYRRDRSIRNMLSGKPGLNQEKVIDNSSCERSLDIQITRAPIAKAKMNQTISLVDIKN